MLPTPDHKRGDGTGDDNCNINKDCEITPIDVSAVPRDLRTECGLGK